MLKREHLTSTVTRATRLIPNKNVCSMSYSKKSLNYNETRKNNKLKSPACKKKLPPNKAIAAGSVI